MVYKYYFVKNPLRFFSKSTKKFTNIHFTVGLRFRFSSIEIVFSTQLKICRLQEKSWSKYVNLQNCKLKIIQSLSETNYASLLNFQVLTRIQTLWAAN